MKKLSQLFRRLLAVACLLTLLPGLIQGASAQPDVIVLVSFTATAGPGQILIEWETASEMQVVAFCLQRSKQAVGDYARISECIPASGDLVSGATYQVPDADVVPGTLYYYRLEVFSTGGTAESHGPISARAEAAEYPTYWPLMLKITPPGWLDVTPGVTLQVPRAYYTATRLADGKILLVGGSRAPLDFLAEVELFDPAIGLARLVAPLHTARHQHTATLLSDGRVLVVGGYSLPGQWRVDAEVYDPVADTWTVVSPRNSFGVSHTATLMKDGRVLLVGGAIDDSRLSEAVEIFNPQTNAWTEAAPLKSVRASHTAQLLEDGRVLVAGGYGYGDVPPADGDALLFDPLTDTWTATGRMIQPRTFSESVRLPDGRVLVAGGLFRADNGSDIALASVEMYDPAANTWTAAAPLALPRVGHALVLLPNGQVLAVGGSRTGECCWTGESFVPEIESYDPTADDWRGIGWLWKPRAEATATLLWDAHVWLAGGLSDTTYFSDTSLIGPVAPPPPPPGQWYNPANPLQE